MAFNLTEGLAKSFEFSGEIDGKVHKYEAFYPTAKQIQPMQTGWYRLQAINEEFKKPNMTDEQKKKYEDEIKEITDKMTQAYESMFKPLDDSMPINDFIESLPRNAKDNFDKMVKVELFGVNE